MWYDSSKGALMPTIAAVATAVPPYELSQPVARAHTERLLVQEAPQLRRYLSVLDHAEIDTRYLAAPLEWLAAAPSFGAANDRFIAVASELGASVARACLAQAGVTPAEVDHLIFVTTTGLAAPS